MIDSESNKKSMELIVSQYPNHDLYTINSDNLNDLEKERNYFIELFGGDNIGNETIMVSPIIQNGNTYTFMIISKINEIINKYRRRIGNYQPKGYMDYITR